MVKVIGFTMILLGAIGIGTALIDWQKAGRPPADGQRASAGATNGELNVPAGDRLAEGLGEDLAEDPGERVAKGEAVDEEAVDGQVAGTGDENVVAPDGVATAIVTRQRDPANVKVFEQEDENDDSGPALWADITTASEVVSEDSGHVSYLVTLSEPADRSVVIIFSTVSLSANDDEDYRGQRGTVTFQPGVVSAEIRTPLLDDDIKEEDEQFAIVLNGAPGTVNFRGRRITTTIRDDD